MIINNLTGLTKEISCHNNQIKILMKDKETKNKMMIIFIKLMKKEIHKTIFTATNKTLITSINNYLHPLNQNKILLPTIYILLINN